MLITQQSIGNMKQWDAVTTPIPSFPSAANTLLDMPNPVVVTSQFQEATERRRATAQCLLALRFPQALKEAPNTLQISLAPIQTTLPNHPSPLSMKLQISEI